MFEYETTPGPSGMDAGGVRRNADGAIIPDDPENVDWQAYQAWLKAGNTPSAPDAPAPA